MFYKNVIESASDEESDDDSEQMMAAAMLLDRDYFLLTKPIFDAETFWRRYRMSRKLFMTILNRVRA
jgi:hypothetical protein